MLNILKLLLPALLPSWNFFDVIVASPRIQLSLLKSADDIAEDWHEFRPRPDKLSFTQMLLRLFWNPNWNDSLYLVSCAERLQEFPTRHSEDEILKRIVLDLKSASCTKNDSAVTHVQFRLVFIHREGSELVTETTYYSRVEPLNMEVNK